MIQSPCGLTARMNDSRTCPSGFNVASDSRLTGASSSASGGEQLLSGTVPAAVGAGLAKVCGPKRATGSAALASTAMPSLPNCNAPVIGGNSCARRAKAASASVTCKESALDNWLLLGDSDGDAVG